MKSILSKCLLAAALLAAPQVLSAQTAVAASKEADCTFCIATDIHLMAPSLLVEEGKAYEDYMKRDRKMLKESPLLLDELTKGILKEHPSFVLVPGDLTKDGERVSHDYLVENSFRKFKNAGINVFVVPGNHDIKNPHAVAFKKDTTERVTTISRDEFDQIYADYGYRDALSRDEASLSYVAQLTPSLRLLALDACMYDSNDFEANTCEHAGTLRPATLQFVERELKKAQQAGQKVVAMMHHGLTEHWKYQNRVLAGYVVSNADALTKLFQRYDVRVIFTGHLHTNDVSRVAPGLYDVETGSPVSYASPYRVVRMTADSLHISTRNITRIKGYEGDEAFPRFARAHTAAGIESIANTIFPADVPADLKKEALEVFAQAMMDNYRGGETLSSEKKQQINMLARRLRKYTFKWSMIFKRVTKSLLTDLTPADETLSLPY